MGETERRRGDALWGAARRAAALLMIAMCLGAAAACAQEASALPQISDIRLLRKLGDTTRALEYVQALLADASVSAEIRREAYGELVTITLATEGRAAAQAAARLALGEFPDLQADPANHPEEIQQIYENLRAEMFGRLHLTSNPDHCTILLNDKEIGSTPLEGKLLPAGEYTFRISKIGYEDDTLHVSIAGGAEVKRFAELRWVRTTAKLRLGFEIAVSALWLNYGAGTDGTFGGFGTVRDDSYVMRFSGGIFLHSTQRDRMAVQIGARYISKGNAAEYGGIWASGGSAEYESHLTYLAVPAALKFYPVLEPRIFGCVGAEVAYLLSAKLSESGGSTSEDIKDYLPSIAVSLMVGAGCEIGVGSHFVSISVLYVGGLTSLRNSELLDQIDSTTQEVKIALGYLL